MIELLKNFSRRKGEEGKVTGNKRKKRGGVPDVGAVQGKRRKRRPKKRVRRKNSRESTVPADSAQEVGGEQGGGLPRQGTEGCAQSFFRIGAE